MRLTKLATCLLTVGYILVAAAFARAGVEAYQIDPVHSGVVFKVRHMVVTNVTGLFETFDGTIHYDAANVENSSVEVTIQTASISTRNEKRDNHLRSSDFLSVEEFPTITFKSKRVAKAEGDNLLVVGDLTIRGVTKEVEIPFVLNGPVTSPWGQVVIGASGTLEINRQDYGVSWSKAIDNGGLVASDIVKIELNVEAAKVQS